MQRQWPSLNAFNTRYVQWEIGGSQEFCRTKINVMHSLEMWKHRNIRSFLTVQFTSPRIIWIFQKWYNRTQVAGSRSEIRFFGPCFFILVYLHFWWAGWKAKSMSDFSEFQPEAAASVSGECWVGVYWLFTDSQSCETGELVLATWCAQKNLPWIILIFYSKKRGNQE